MKLRKTYVALAAVAAATCGPIGVTAASADNEVVSDTVYIEGSGAIAPGLPGTPSSCVYTFMGFNGTAVVVGDDTQVGAVGFGTNSTVCETEVSGAGVGNFNGIFDGAFGYDRTGTQMTIVGHVFLNNQTHTITAGECEFTPTSVNPISTFRLDCTAVLTS